MKRVLIFISIITGAACLTMMAQTKPQSQTKTYNVSLTKEAWYSVLNGLEAIKSTVKMSNMPANQSTYISDSLITVYQVEFSRQINLQLDSEKSKPDVKKDTTKPKKQ